MELDGAQHIDSARDAARTRYLESEGWTVIRFWNSEVAENPDGVAEAILLKAAECLGGTHPQPSGWDPRTHAGGMVPHPLFQGREGKTSSLGVARHGEARRREMRRPRPSAPLHRTLRGHRLGAMVETVTLWRPVGPAELALIRQSGMSAFPPRLTEQPIFCPVLSEDYAVKIARDWNVPADGSGFVTRFEVRRDFLDRYQVREAGGRAHRE